MADSGECVIEKSPSTKLHDPCFCPDCGSSIKESSSSSGVCCFYDFGWGPVNPETFRTFLSFVFRVPSLLEAQQGHSRGTASSGQVFDEFAT